MKVTLWQQFSSNHSAGFEMVGEFRTIEEAQEVADIARRIIREVREWYSANHSSDEIEIMLERNELLPLTPIERTLKQDYKLDNWSYSLDWSLLLKQDGENQHVRVFDNLVFVISPSETWLDSQPFDALFKTRNATIAQNVSSLHPFTPCIKVTTQAKDSTTAKTIVENLQDEEKQWHGENRFYVQLPQRGRFRAKISATDKQITIADIRLGTFNLNDFSIYHAADFLQHLKTYLEGFGCSGFDITIYESQLED